MDELVAIRRDIHANPELGFEETRTSEIVAQKLKEFGVDEVHTGIAKTGVVGVIRGTGGSNRAIGLRADMDALPINELTNLPYGSKTDGKMHACGHDGHTTMLLGAARYLADHRNFDGTVYLIFQPAEEGRGGGKVMIEEGLFDRFNCETVYGMHNMPGLPLGTISMRPGPCMAAADEFKITVMGKGGHGAMPNVSRDPVVIGSHIVTALQSIASRRVDPIKEAVVSVTQFHAGDAFNVIPEYAELSGTCRTFLPEVRDLVETELKRIATNVALAFDATAEITYMRNYPPTINTAEETEIAADAARKVAGEGVDDRRSEDGRGGLLLHARGAAGRLYLARQRHARREGRRQRPHAAVRLQRRRHPLRRRLLGIAGGNGTAEGGVRSIPT